MCRTLLHWKPAETQTNKESRHSIGVCICTVHVCFSVSVSVHTGVWVCAEVWHQQAASSRVERWHPGLCCLSLPTCPKTSRIQMRRQEETAALLTHTHKHTAWKQKTWKGEVGVMKWRKKGWGEEDVKEAMRKKTPSQRSIISHKANTTLEQTDINEWESTRDVHSHRLCTDTKREETSIKCETEPKHELDWHDRSCVAAIFTLSYCVIEQRTGTDLCVVLTDRKCSMSSTLATAAGLGLCVCPRTGHQSPTITVVTGVNSGK